MDTTDSVKPEKIERFWNAYRACVEAHHIPPQHCAMPQMGARCAPLRASDVCYLFELRDALP